MQNISRNATRTLIPIAVLFLLLTLASCASRTGLYPQGYAVASWYGSEFHGRPTSSGETFNMYALTCAHREYPFGTQLRVTNVDNQKAVSCVVNDRGPFVAGRDIDLSYAAAKEIGLIGKGTGHVSVEHMGRDIAYIREVKYMSRSGPFTIQVGSFSDYGNAVRLKNSLELKYERVYIMNTEIKGETFYRVRIGKYPLRDEAYIFAKTLAEEGYAVLVTRYEERI
ncbi:MAG: septal ring lytic transglycosylase RlpA family protein [Thermodesulfovibrionales bacterium]|nr:septal ring lytic transglycosylase RlpA family protein [Thermodesulfovibrionales bacterium]